MGAIFSFFGPIGNSITNITNNLNKNITNLVITSVQTSVTNVDQNQILDVDCTQWAEDQKEGKMSCVQQAADLMKLGKSAEEAIQLCKIWENGTCGANQVNMKDLMQTKIDENMSLKIKTYIQNNIKSAIDNAASQSGSGGISNSVTSGVGSEIDNIQSAIQNYLQSSYNNISSQQTVKVKDGYVTLVTQDAFTMDFSKFTASNTVYTSSVNKIASKIKNSTQQNLGSSSIITIIVIIIIILIIGAIIVWLWQKRNSKKTSTSVPQLPNSIAPKTSTSVPQLPNSIAPKISS